MFCFIGFKDDFVQLSQLFINAFFLRLCRLMCEKAQPFRIAFSNFLRLCRRIRGIASPDLRSELNGEA